MKNERRQSGAFDQAVHMTPIGVFSSQALYPYDVPRQGAVAGANQGVIHLASGRQFEEGLEELSAFSHIWVLYCFHRNDSWHPKVQPPRHIDRKVGVFATRSPYRPNPIGISAVCLERIEGLDVWISGHDLLDGTPILDIKPYLPYADSFPAASLGWTGEHPERDCQVVFQPSALAQLAWLESKGVSCLKQFVQTQLGYDPLNGDRHRLLERTDKGAVLAYRTWRVRFECDRQVVLVTEVFSGYSSQELAEPSDRYADKDIHRGFVLQDWPD